MRFDLESLRGGLIVSCQSSEDEPFHSPDMMARMAIAAEMGGARGIRANSPEDIQEIKKRVSLPIIGIFKKEDHQSDEAFITADMERVDQVVAAGADIVAIDCTFRKNAKDEYAYMYLPAIKEKYPQNYVMADISTVEEAKNAERWGADLIASTLHGLVGKQPTSDTLGLLIGSDGPHVSFVQELVHHCQIPVIAEGGISSPKDLADILDTGCFAAVVGSAITRPHIITKKFVKAITDKEKQKGEFA